MLSKLRALVQRQYGQSIFELAKSGISRLIDFWIELKYLVWLRML